ncbi:pseudouridine synthase, partial [Fragilariopsis cylindrus CCMP1102]
MDGKLIEANYKFLRTIKPYAYTYTTYAKGRWEGRTILDVYSTEYGAYPNSYYVTAISQGRILVSDTKVSTSYIIKGGDILSHTVHRHEPGVAVQSDVEPYVTVVEETDELLIVDKPGTMAVHPCGGYNMQSLVNILIEHYTSPLTGGKIEKLYPVHRLDRLTSGLIILGKNSSVAQTLGKCIMNRGCQKLYLARVKGKFPLKIVKHKDGVCETSSFDDLSDELYKKTVKPAHTAFGVVSYDEKTDSTLVICRPYTGRTHQLRLHLQHLEHPIANDPNY